ncbi:MAG: DUF1127 domain-containing protein [Pseudomonadota bacterium]
MIDNIVRQYSSWRRYRSTYDSLMKLSNRELDDLGLSRADIDMVARRVAK